MRVVALSVGIVAARALREGASGMVRSVFERSFYLTLGDAWICVGPPGLGDGPLNVMCALVNAVPEHTPPTATRHGRACSGYPPLHSGEHPKAWMPATSVGMTAEVTGNALYIGDVLVIDLGVAAVWSPPQPDETRPIALLRSLVTFDAALPAELPREGLALLLRLASDEAACPAVARAAYGPAAVLARMVSHADCVDTERLAPLVGLGPGLTPSGDDFLGGGMVALTCLGMNLLRDRIWATLAPVAATHTNDISRAHLAAAAEGYGSAPLHNLIDAIIAGDADAIPQRIAALAVIGHTSGWDAMAGVVTVLRAAAQR